MAWPPGARLHPLSGTGRFPIPLAWPLLDHAAEAHWKWQFQDRREATCAPAQAIACLVEAALGHSRICLDGCGISLAVPNTLDVEAQDRLLTALRLNGSDVHLLWRPVASALTWVDTYGQDLLRESCPKNLGTYEPYGLLWVVHLGLDAFEVTQLELIPWEHDGARLLLPARRLPSLPTLYGMGLAWAEAMAERALTGMENGPGTAWGLLWTTDWLARVNSQLAGHPAGSEDSEPNHLLYGPLVVDRGTTAARTLLKEVNSFSVPSDASLSLTEMRRSFAPLDGTYMGQPEARVAATTSLEDWIGELKSLVRTDLPVVGIIGTGAFAALPAGSQTLCEYVAELAGGQLRTSRRLIDSRCAAISRGAAVHTLARRENRPSYLDVLPKLELLVVRNGDPVFDDILRVETPYVMGGREHLFEPSDLNLGIGREEQSVTLSVWRQGHRSVRSVKVEFPRRVPGDVPVQLQVKMTSGQGNPRVEVKPQIHVALGGQRVYLDWARAKDTGRSREEELEQVPRTSPPAEPRLASLKSWNGGEVKDHYNRTYWLEGAASKIEQLLEDLDALCRRKSFVALKERLADVTKALRDKDGEFADKPIPEHATAVSSDGQLHPEARDPELLVQLTTKLDRLLHRQIDSDCMAEAMRVLGYCSAETPYLRECLDAVLQHPRDVTQFHLVAIGNCMREPGQINVMAQSMLANLRSRNPRAPNNWMRALCRILQYRHAATEEVDPEICEALSTYCLPYMDKQIRDNNAQLLYRHASLCIVYLLRKRRQFDAYLNPEGEHAAHVKDIFRLAIKKFEAGKLRAIEGFVNLPHVTRLMIDYIDRKGQGRLIGLSVGD